MNWIRAAAALTLSSILVSSFGCDALAGESKAWRDQVQETVIALQESVDALALSVPGERWARQMEALTHPDPEKRKKALEEIVTGVGQSLGRPQTVRAVLGSKDSGSIRGRFFMAPTNQIAELESFCTQGAFVSLHVWKNSLTRPKTPDEIKKATRDQAQEFVDTVFGVPPTPPRFSGLEGSGAQPFNWEPPPFGTPLNRLSNRQRKNLPVRREQAITALADLMALHYGEIGLDNRGDAVEHDWSSTEGFGVLHVVIPADDLERLDRIDAWIHEKGKPESTWDGMNPVVLTPASFRALPKETVKRCIADDERLYWTAADLAKSVYHSTPSAQVVQQLAKLREAVNKLKQIY